MYMQWMRILPLVLVGLMLGGCALVGWTADVIEGGKKVPAVYELEDRPTVVMIDDPTHKLPTIDLPNLIAGRVGDRLVGEKVISDKHMVAANRISQLAADEPNFAGWSIDRIGREAGAEQVIYAVVQRFTVTDEESHMYRPTAQMRIKVIDVASGQRLFPEAGEGYPVAVEQFYQSMDGSNPSTHTILARRLAEELAATMARLFYQHLPTQPGSRLPG